MIKEKMKEKHSNNLLVEGVTFDAENNSFTFDFEHDSRHDLVKLVADGPYMIEDYDPCIYYGYVFEDGIDSRLKKQFIDLIKYPSQQIQESDLNRFIVRSVANLDKKISLPKYDAIVHPQSSSDLNAKIIREIYNRSLSDKVLEIELIKDLPSKMEFNYDLYVDSLKHKTGINQKNIDNSVLAIKRMMDDIRKLDYVKLGTYVKAKYRPYIKNFFYFKDEDSKKAYESLQGKNVLIVDDVSTTRATLQYVLNAIRLVNDSCSIAMFCLLGNRAK